MKNFARVVGSILIEFRADGQTGAAVGDGRGVRATAGSRPDHCGADEGRPGTASSCELRILRSDQDAASSLRLRSVFLSHEHVAFVKGRLLGLRLKSAPRKFSRPESKRSRAGCEFAFV